MSDNEQWLKELRADITGHLEQHTQKSIETLRRLPPGSDAACRTAADLAATEQALETIRQRT
jgi:hypothetical protein